MVCAEDLEGLKDIYKELAEEIGFDNTKKVYNLFKGTQVSFPASMYSTDYLHCKIIKEYNGNNIKELAKQYGYSERTIRRILSSID